MVEYVSAAELDRMAFAEDVEIRKVSVAVESHRSISYSVCVRLSERLFAGQAINSVRLVWPDNDFNGRRIRITADTDFSRFDLRRNLAKHFKPNDPKTNIPCRPPVINKRNAEVRYNESLNARWLNQSNKWIKVAAYPFGKNIGPVQINEGALGNLNRFFGQYRLTASYDYQDQSENADSNCCNRSNGAVVGLQEINGAPEKISENIKHRSALIPWGFFLVLIAIPIVGWLIARDRS